MQSYLDLSMLLVIGITVVLLILILVSFIILSRRSGQLETLQAAAAKKTDDLGKKLTALTASLAEAEKKLQLSQTTVSYLTDRQQSAEDNLKSLKDENARLRQELRDLASAPRQSQIAPAQFPAAAQSPAAASPAVSPAQNAPAAAPQSVSSQETEQRQMQQAEMLLRQGVGLDEISKVTGLPRHELETLSALKQVRVPAAHASSASSASSAAAASEPSVTAVPEPAAESVPDILAPKAHVAGLKARNAYGIPRATLRRSR